MPMGVHLDAGERAVLGDHVQVAIEVEIDAESVDTNSSQRDAHLKSPDFFSVKEFPTITFKSKKVKEKGDMLHVTGDLTLHGVKKEITAEVEHIGSAETFQGYKAGFEARFKIDGRDFDLAFMKQQPGALGPESEVIVSLECKKR